MFDCAISWTVADQAPPSMEFSRQEYCSGLPFPSSGDLPDPGMELGSPALQANSLPPEPPGKSIYTYMYKLLYFKISFAFKTRLSHLVIEITMLTQSVSSPKLQTESQERVSLPSRPPDPIHRTLLLHVK